VVPVENLETRCRVCNQMVPRKSCHIYKYTSRYVGDGGTSSPKLFSVCKSCLEIALYAIAINEAGDLDELLLAEPDEVMRAELRSLLLGTFNQPALWLVTPNSGFCGFSPLDYIKDGNTSWVLDRLGAVMCGSYS
jgi:hypothetical protein